MLTREDVERITELMLTELTLDSRPSGYGHMVQLIWKQRVLSTVYLDPVMPRGEHVVD